jgi:hypothetical protein
MFLVQNFDGQFGVGGILELGFEEPRWGLTVTWRVNQLSFFLFLIHPSVFSSLMKKLWDMGPSLIL